jgi:Protein of unknown function (DUF3352)
MTTPSVATNSRRGLARWSVAAVATATLVVSGSGLVAFAQSGAGGSQGPVFVPAESAAYVEARLDRPGGQAEALAQMMTAFPGFADAGSFDLKVDELLGGLGSQLGVTMPDGALFGDVLTGEIGLGVSDLESAMSGGDPSVIVGLAVADEEAAGAVVDALITQGSDLTTSTYNDVTIYTDASSSPPMSAAMYDGWILIGTGEAMVQGSIDTLDGTAPSLAEDADFGTAWGRLPDARLGAVYVDFASLAPMLDMASMMASGQTGMDVPMVDLAGMLPVDMTASLVAENDRLNLEVLVTPGEQMPDIPVGESDLALAFPADTQVYLETRELGATIQNSLGQLATMLEAQAPAPADGSSGMSDIEMLFSEDSPITAMLGVPLPEFLDFVGDAGVGAGLSSDGLWLGIAGELNDAAVATERVNSLLTILRMVLLQGDDPGISVETSEVAGVEVTTINLPIDETMAQSGVPLSVGNSIDVALTDDKLLIGLGDFVENAIVADSADSLGASAGFTDAIADDAQNSGVLYVNISSLLGALDPMLAMMSPEWESIKPYATGLDRMVVVGTADEDVLRGRMTIIVGQ